MEELVWRFDMAVDAFVGELLRRNQRAIEREEPLAHLQQRAAQRVVLDWRSRG